MNPLEQLAAKMEQDMQAARDYREKTLESFTQRFGENVSKFIDETMQTMLLASQLAHFEPRDPVMGPLFKEMLARLCAMNTDANRQLYCVPREAVTEYMDMAKELAHKLTDPPMPSSKPTEH